ncbi:predicted protein [Chaetomium globosum CBS 148.51]|uniref:Uncharacterized protein n=1 Tax=Chaetomium globosum (strain ATCC 6205 / CBS 148.51 / DSM 1962 / NBRC 6347 / NRRL 1970) TaxID=306901 RepID=Q2HIC6_CHAGB|nr:uncharacterized protein CHGG_00028 [Chaetomium globosum CBS 148.51]EAQ91793.1 predicted protein [Chaetomium globosum CBS 148.51]
MPPKSKYTNRAEDTAGNANGDGPLSVLTAREQTMLLQGLLTVPGFPGGIQIDYPKVAERMGLKNPRSVANAWSLIKGKINAYDKKYREDNNLPSAAEEAAAVAQADDAEDENPAPKKRARASKIISAAAAKSAVAPAPRCRKPAAAAKAPRWPRHSIMGPLSEPLATPGEWEEDEEEAEEEMGAADLGEI